MKKDKSVKSALRLKKDYIKKATRSFIGWKKAYESLIGAPHYCDRSRPLIVKLRIPVGATHIQGKWDCLPPANAAELCYAKNDDHKRRASKAIVLEITHVSGIPYTGPCAIAGRSKNFRYVVGETVVPQFPFDREDIACGSGIHFFSTRKQAENY